MEDSNITITIAFLAGLASFLSPCVLPLVPGYISLISGVSIDRLKGQNTGASAARRAVIINSLAFNAGLSMIFVSLGAAAGWVGASVTSNSWVRITGGMVIVAFGLQLIGLLKISVLYRDTRHFSQERPRGILGSFALGMAFAAGWTPCIGPILGGIIGLAATSGGWRTGLMLSIFYAAGLALPFLLTGLGINPFLGFYAKFRRHLHKVEVFSGMLLILVGLLVASGQVTRLSQLASSMPNMEAQLISWLRFKPVETTVSGSAPATPVSAFESAPEVELQTVDGQPFHLSDLRGRVVVLNFWATWCAPCRAEIPAFNQIQRELEGQGLQVVGVLSQDTPEAFREFQKEIKQDYTILLGNDEMSAKFGNGPGLPVTIIIDRQGRMRKKIFGGNERATFEAIIRPLLDDAPTTARK
ncbi:MAG: hypothetical protein AUG51_14345 [Acidobacteria bacterium 13_1_20CM_3_53_8]|nr:MAG: hypothetical protein AUG51_14345 [Acidobacteria bacterium 13_1_20CM_3_53_8]